MQNKPELPSFLFAVQNLQDVFTSIVISFSRTANKFAISDWKKVGKISKQVLWPFLWKFWLTNQNCEDQNQVVNDVKIRWTIINYG